MQVLSRSGLAVLVALTACGGAARLPVEAGMGPNPQLPPPRTSLIPVVKVAKAVGWSEGEKPAASDGMSVAAFASGLAHPRWLYVLPNGDVLVAETNAPADRVQEKGIRAWFMKRYFKKAGAAVPSANRITILRDTNGDGIADVRSALLRDLYSPFGMTLIGDTLYVANANAVMKFPYRPGQLTIAAPGTKIVEFPGSKLNHHWTRSMVASADGSRLYVGVGSNSNVGEKGMPEEDGRAADRWVWRSTNAAPCSSPTTSGTRSGASLERPLLRGKDLSGRGRDALWAAAVRPRCARAVPGVRDAPHRAAETPTREPDRRTAEKNAQRTK